MTLRWPAHRTSQSKVPCTWGFLTNVLVMAPWPVFTCLGFVSLLCVHFGLYLCVLLFLVGLSELGLGLAPCAALSVSGTATVSAMHAERWLGVREDLLGGDLLTWSSRQSRR